MRVGGGWGTGFGSGREIEQLQDALRDQKATLAEKDKECRLAIVRAKDAKRPAYSHAMPPLPNGRRCVQERLMN